MLSSELLSSSFCWDRAMHHLSRKHLNLREQFLQLLADTFFFSALLAQR